MFLLATFNLFPCEYPYNSIMVKSELALIFDKSIRAAASPFNNPNIRTKSKTLAALQSVISIEIASYFKDKAGKIVDEYYPVFKYCKDI